MLRELNMTMDIPIKKERDQNNKQMQAKKLAITSNATAMAKIKAHNTFDSRLYAIAVNRFCQTTRKYPDLFLELQANTKVSCPP